MSVLVLLVASVSATETRVMTMGDNNTILLDEHNITIFPSRLYDYPNLAIAEFSNNDFTKFGVHWKFNEDKPWILGVYLHNGTPSDAAFNPIDLPSRLGSYTDMSNQRMDMYYARMLGDSKFGFHFGLVHSSAKHDTDVLKDESAFSTYRFDVGVTPKDNKYDVSAGLDFMSYTDKETYNDGTNVTAVDVTEPDGNMGFYFMTRMFHQIDVKTVFVPHAGIRYGKYSSNYYDETGDTMLTSVENKVIAIDLGVGMQYTPTENVLAVLDFGLSYDNVTTDSYYPLDTLGVEDKNKVTSLPYIKMGLDAEVFKWMDVRFGATSYWDSETEETNYDNIVIKHTYKYPENETYLGFGFHWNDLHVDVYSNPEMFLDGFNFLSGSTNNMNFRISAVYEML